MNLKPCPFCGSRNLRYDWKNGTAFPVSIICLNCGASIDSQSSQERAAERWNCRVEVSA